MPLRHHADDHHDDGDNDGGDDDYWDDDYDDDDDDCYGFDELGNELYQLNGKF